MRWINKLCLVAFLFLLPAGVRAADDDAAIIAPYVDGNTLVVIRVEPAAIDFDVLQTTALNALKAGKQADDLKAEVMKNLPQATIEAKRWIADFKKAGGTTIYFCLNHADMNSGPILVMPLKEGADGKAIVNLMVSGFPDQASKPGAGGQSAVITGNCVIAGDQTILNRLKNRPAVPRPEFAAVLSSAGDGPIRAAFIPSELLRNSIIQAIPQLPAQFGSVQSADIIERMVSISGEISLGTKMSVRVVSQYKDTDSAAIALRASMAMKDALKKSERDFTGYIDIVEKLLSSSVTRDGDKVICDLEGDAFNDFLTFDVVQVFKACAYARRLEDASNLKQIGMAMLIYADDPNGDFPPDLGTLIKDKISQGEIFLSPLTDHKLPENWSKMNLDEQAKWINENSDYVYTAPGVKFARSPAAILAYDKADLEKSGVNILFDDVHVEYVKQADIKAAFEKDKEARKNAR